MQIVVYATREWATKIFHGITIEKKILITNPDYNILNSINPDAVFFLGWSHIIPNEVVSRFKCICLHPSPLPKYRGGSPIQNQIINGETDSAVTLFIMDGGIDTGPILFQQPISLSGSLIDIFNEIIRVGILGINWCIENPDAEAKEQDSSISTFFKRRTPKQSEITIDEIKTMTALQLHNKIRCLQFPYPLPYILCADGNKLFITEAILEK